MAIKKQDRKGPDIPYKDVLHLLLPPTRPHLRKARNSSLVKLEPS
jgi:hypothetical protein